MLSECRKLRSQQPLCTGTQTEVKEGRDLGTLCVEHTSLICTVSMLLYNPIGKTYTQIPNSENIGEVSWMSWVPLVAQTDLAAQLR